MGVQSVPGAKKAAHYSLPLPCGTRAWIPVRRRRLTGLLPAFLTLGWLLAAPYPAVATPTPPQSPEARKAETDLEAVKSEIERVTREVSAEQVERNRMTRDLRSAEISVGKAREVLSDVRRQRAEHAARRAALESEQHDREAELDRNRDALAGQLRAAYLIGRQEPLKLLLNQEDPARAGRMFIYYGYFGRARAGQIKLIEDDVQRIAQLESEVDAEDQQLALLETQQRAQLSELEHSRHQRTQALAGLEAEAHTRAQNLGR
ncbi:MAG: hypothetical protein WCA14_11995, partial [Steroidobacteraceae bacterium]